MTETTEVHPIDREASAGRDEIQHESMVIAEALGVIDSALLTMSGRELVSSSEVADLLLDVRMLLSSPATTAAN